MHEEATFDVTTAESDESGSDEHGHDEEDEETEEYDVEVQEPVPPVRPVIQRPKPLKGPELLSLLSTEGV